MGRSGGGQSSHQFGGTGGFPTGTCDGRREPENPPVTLGLESRGHEILEADASSEVCISKRSFVASLAQDRLGFA